MPTSFVDIELSQEIQEYRDPAFDIFMRGVSWFGVNEVAIASIVLVSILSFIYSMKREALFVVLTSITSIITFGLKLLVARTRPSDDFVQIIEVAHNNSFPSGHTAHYVTFFRFLLVLLFRLRKLNPYLRFFFAVLFLLLIVAVPFSRMYLGVHWFTDVLAGFLLGLLILAVLLYFYFRKPYDLKKYFAL
ncbi:MAG: phosphatase PAP2 family protein [Bacteroidota bacterium]|nr:phosphatase PAP2 family protein [Bacteroidota bacterium]